MAFHFLLVGIGGALGAMLRHGVGLMTMRITDSAFPWATLTINVVGSLYIGLIAGLLALTPTWSQEIRLFAVVGVLGGFTTFSAFSLDTILLFERGQTINALLYVAGSVVISIAAAVLGLFLMRAAAG